MGLEGFILSPSPQSSPSASQRRYMFLNSGESNCMVRVGFCSGVISEVFPHFFWYCMVPHIGQEYDIITAAVIQPIVNGL